MIKLIVKNKKTIIKNIPSKILKKLNKLTSYMVEGFYFAPSYKKKYWDGKLRLLNFSKKLSCYRFPTGLLQDVIKCLDKNKITYDLKDKRKRQTKKIKCSWNPKVKLRKYQKKAVKRLIKKGPYQGRGILNTPIRSGKTKMASGVIYKLKAKTLFIVTSQMLLWQSKKDISETLQIDVGVIGDGHWIEKDVTIATAQTLMSARKAKASSPQKKKYKKLCENYDLVFFDECHHLTSLEWHKIMQNINAYYKIGLSATVMLKSEDEQGKGVIWLKACCGNVKYKVSASYLIRKGYLVRPDVIFHPIRKPNLIGKKWSKTLQKQAILLNPYRNKRILKLTRKYALKNNKIVILSNSLEQIDLLAGMLDEYNLPFATITGSVKTKERERIKEEFTQGECDILMGTVLSEGVDIPEIDVVIIAEGGKNAKKTTQRLRNLTPSKGKTKAIVIEFADLMNEYFVDHTRNRLDVYRSEEEFNVRYKVS